MNSSSTTNAMIWNYCNQEEEEDHTGFLKRCATCHRRDGTLGIMITFIATIKTDY
jgi:hypothetical protein